jgi:peptide/nickel transport system substrate-binding protein
MNERRIIRMKANRLLAVAAAATVLVSSGCSSSTSASPVKDGGTLRLGTASGIDSLNPFVAVEQDGYATFELIYPQLVQYDAKMAFAPDFALSWSTSPDGKVWTFKTRPGATWSDGKPLTARDAAWTYSTILKFASDAASNQAATLSHLHSAQATDDNTLVLTYDAPVVNVLSNLQQLPVLPEHVWSQYATGDGKALKTFANTPTANAPIVSGGPFTMVKYQKDQIALFKRNPKWYGDKPHMDGFGLQYFSNEDAMVTALKNGEIDAVESLPVTAVDTAKKAGLNVEVSPRLEFRELIINSNPKKPKHRELLDPKVREALEHAIDREAIVKTAWLGYAKPGASIIPESSGSGWNDPNVKALPFDIAKANALLDAAGYTKGSDGIRRSAGQPMSYEVVIPNSERGAGDRAFQIIQSGLKQVGIAVAPRYMDSSAATDAILAPDGKYLDFDLAMWDWVPLIDPDFMLSVLTCNAYGDWNDSGYCNPAYDKLYDEQGKAIDDAKRHEIVHQMQQMVYQDRPYVVLSNNDTITAWNKSWTGFGQNPQGLYNALTKQGFLQAHRS